MRDRRSYMIALVALVFGVASLTIGYAAFSNSLTIKSSAEVKPASNTLNIGFSTVNNAITAGTVTATAVGTGASGADATISGTTISGIKATFTAPGQSVTYSFNVYNASSYVAYLNSVAYANASGESSFKVCTAKTGTTQSYVTSACDGISVTVSVGSYSTNQSVASGISHSLAATTGEAVTVTIAYASGSTEADGDFDVAFGDITLGYSTVNS